MRPSDLLFLVIALIYIPQERSCYRIRFFYLDIWDYHNCYSNVTGQMILYPDREKAKESLDTLPSQVILQMKCPYFPGNARGIIKGRTDGRWMVLDAVAVKTCAYEENRATVKRALHCYTFTHGYYYMLYLDLPMYYTVSKCSIRLFLADVGKIETWPTILDDHGMVGVSDEVPLKKFGESQYYLEHLDSQCGI